jgi:endonuclease G
MRALLFLFLFISLSAFADCPQLYPLGRIVTVPDGVELCNSFYVVQFDAKHNEPVFSSERFHAVAHVPRVDAFRADVRLGTKFRAVPYDYHGTGYDKGHLTPAGDAANSKEMFDTFLMSNMTPQEPTLNEQNWRILEENIRLTKPDYVLTGALYGEDPKTVGAHHVPVPYGYYKIAYKHGMIAAWLAENTKNAKVSRVPLESIEAQAGLKFPRYGE